MQIIQFGLHFFIFLLTESLINERAAVIFGAANVNYIYAIGLLFTALGYLLFSYVKDHIIKQFTIILGVVAFLAIMCGLNITSISLFLIFNYTALLSLGYIGGFVHYTNSLHLNEKNYSLYLSISAMLGVIAQYIAQNTGLSNAMYVVVIELGLLLIYIIPFSAKTTSDRESDNNKFSSTTNCFPKVFIYIIAVAIMSIILGFQDSIIVFKNATGSFQLFSYIRLFYALGLVLAGCISNIRNRIYLPLASGCAMFLSVLSMSFLSNSEALCNVSVGIMYFYCGFYVMFMTIMFMELALCKDNPRMFSGLGRIVRSISTCIIVLITTYFSDYIGEHVYTVLSCLLSITLLIIMALSGILLPNDLLVSNVPLRVNYTCISERLTEICNIYLLTQKEGEVLTKLITTELGVQEIADEMCVSRRVLQRHISSIYKKTDTKTRAGLCMLLNR